MNDEKIELVISGDEEVPTGVKKLLKVIEPAMGAEDRERIDRLVEKSGKLLAYIEREKSSVQSIIDSVMDLRISVDNEKRSSAGLSEKFDRLVALLDRDKERMQRVEESISAFLDAAPLGDSIKAMESIRDSLEAVVGSVKSNEERIVSVFSRAMDSIESISASMAEMKSRLNESQEYARVVADEMRARGAQKDSATLVVENINDKIDAYIENINNRLDSMSVQMLSQMNDMSIAIDEAKAAAQKRPDPPKKELKSVESGIRRINAQLALLRSGYTIENVGEIVRLVRSYRVPKRYAAEKKRLIAVLKAIEDDLLDIFIVKSMTRRMTAAELASLTRFGQARLNKRIIKLMGAGTVVREKKGRQFVFYVAKA